ncbi:MAG: hypothetical protein RMJ55_18220 [Roseiflexaceae bacterium]|nr:hypothetical protein [Roseiflexaceae bacterium]
MHRLRKEQCTAGPGVAGGSGRGGASHRLYEGQYTACASNAPPVRVVAAAAEAVHRTACTRGNAPPALGAMLRLSGFCVVSGRGGASHRLYEGQCTTGPGCTAPSLWYRNKKKGSPS